MTQPPEDGIQPAEVEWGTGQPVSRKFDDVYFWDTEGLAESRHVFLHPNRLPQRFAALRDRGPAHGRFVIGETGFGAGLNFLATWQLWQTTAPAGARLHFVSVEKYPLRRPDLARALAFWPELSTLARDLVESYPAFIGAGVHRLTFDQGQVQLTLIIDDAAAGLEQMLASNHPSFIERGAKIDAWFLDGFSPRKNPDMWRPDLFSVVSALSRPGTSLTSYTAASSVRRGLEAVGFQVTRTPGFGPKRELICAHRLKNPELAASLPGTPRRSHPLPWALPRDSPPLDERRALVIGGGLAGCHSARALAERGFQVTLIERHAQLAAEASGNPQGLLYAKLSPGHSALAAFNLASLTYAQRHYQPFWRQGPEFGQACGVLQLAYNATELALQEQLRNRYRGAKELVQFVEAERASDLAGLPLPHSGLYFPRAGWLDPRQVCEALAHHPNIQRLPGTEIETLHQEGQQWCALGSAGERLASAPIVVVANAREAQRFVQTRDLPLKAIRGQVSYLAANDRSERLRIALCAEGYLAPASQGWHCVGASFNLKDPTPTPSPEDHRSNLDKLGLLGPSVADLFSHQDPEQLTGRVAFRCATRDYLPLIGPVPRREQFLVDYAPLRKDARADLPLGGAYWPGLYLNLGHGSRGLAYTPLSAELLAAQITDDPFPVSRELAQALHPARFLIRDLIRSRI